MAFANFFRHCAGAAFLTTLLGCSAVNNPANVPLSKNNNLEAVTTSGNPAENYVALAFSGGGMRASAFGHGMLLGLREISATAQDPDGILSEVGLVTGVSGGSVTAAHFGLYGPAGVNRYRDIFLVKNGEKYMANSPLNPLTIVRGLSGGANGTKILWPFPG